MTLPQQLRDRAAHRVADGDHRTGSELYERFRTVVGTVGEAEDRAAAHTSAMAAEIGRDDVEMLRERLEDIEPIEAARRDPTVQEQKRRCTGRAVECAHECRAAAGQHN